MQNQNIKEIYEEYAQVVYKYILSLSHDENIAEDILQETFCRATRCIGTYNGDCKLSVWLCQIAKHVWYKELERRNKYKTEYINSDSHNTYGQTQSNPESAIIDAENKIELFKRLQVLDEKSREVVYLRMSGDLSFKEIGEILGQTENWARVTFFRAKKKLTSHL